VISFRREILTEITKNQALYEAFEQTYKDIYRLRERLEFEVKAYDPDDIQRRLETLETIRDTFERLKSGFCSCTSGLRRIGRFAVYAMNTEGYKSLVELLDFDNHMASVDLKLRIGADGRIRRFEIARLTENRKNQFYKNPWGRLSTRVGLVFRGYNFSERELVNRWVDLVFDRVVKLLPPLIQTLGEMEFFLSTLAFKKLAESNNLAVCFPTMHDVDHASDSTSSGHEIHGLFNPLLFGQERVPVPCDLKTEKWETISVVTGPNSGGKTRLLQAVAIAQMLAQNGMYTPGSKASLCRSTGLFVSLIQEIRADQREGRLGTELIRIRNLFEKSSPGSLVVLDELCSGTNPSEGEEIFRLVLSLLKELGPCVFITTHFLKFAAELQKETGNDTDTRFLQVELDGADCPTFHFIPGVATTSLASQTAARLGVTREELFALVRQNRKQYDVPL
jgi:DNA mismatch repair protein MutS2